MYTPSSFLKIGLKTLKRQFPLLKKYVIPISLTLPPEKPSHLPLRLGRAHYITSCAPIMVYFWASSVVNHPIQSRFPCPPAPCLCQPIITTQLNFDEIKVYLNVFIKRPSFTMVGNTPVTSVSQTKFGTQNLTSLDEQRAKYS